VSLVCLCFCLVLFFELVFVVDCGYVVVVGGGDCLVVDFVYDVVGGEDVVDGCFCFVVDDDVVGFVYFELPVEDGIVW